jgi:replicative DNA helicase
MAKTTAWKEQREAYLDALYYIRDRKSGLIKSIRTPWSKFNDATVDGFEWHSMIVIAGRPGSGKTTIKDQIIREVFPLNPHINFNVLEFQFEMVGRTSAIRQFSSVIGQTYKHICSADGILSDEEFTACYDYSKIRTKMPIDIVDDPCTVNEIKEIVDKWFEANAVIVDGKKVYTPGIITLDHSVLVRKASFEKDKMDTLYNLGECITEQKKRYPCIWIILSQLNRNVDSPERNENAKYGNYILDSDIFGADALLQHADTVVAFNRPGAKKIKHYGPDQYIIEDDKVLVGHFLKARNGDTRMSFFRAEFERMQIIEIPTPPRAEKKSFK